MMSSSRRSRYSSRSPSPYRRRYASSSLSRSRSRSRSMSRSRSRSCDSSDVGNLGNNLYVTGLSPRVTKRELEKHFSSKGGTVIDIHLVIDPWTRESRGFGFVTMASVEEADRCIKYMNRSVLEGRVITVEKARRRRGRTPTPGKYLGVKSTHGAVTVLPGTHLRGTGTGPTPPITAGTGHPTTILRGTGPTLPTTDGAVPIHVTAGPQSAGGTGPLPTTAGMRLEPVTASLRSAGGTDLTLYITPDTDPGPDHTPPVTALSPLTTGGDTAQYHAALLPWLEEARGGAYLAAPHPGLGGSLKVSRPSQGRAMQGALLAAPLQGVGAIAAAVA